MQDSVLAGYVHTHVSIDCASHCTESRSAVRDLFKNQMKILHNFSSSFETLINLIIKYVKYADSILNTVKQKTKLITTKR